MACGLGTRLQETILVACNSDFNQHLSHTLCAGIVCPNLSNPGNGQVVQANDGNVPGTVATYSCNAGYRLLGNADRPCGSTGVWSGEAPTCQSKALK